jgi:hypothetical protein
MTQNNGQHPLFSCTEYCLAQVVALPHEPLDQRLIGRKLIRQRAHGSLIGPDRIVLKQEFSLKAFAFGNQSLSRGQDLCPPGTRYIVCI